MTPIIFPLPAMKPIVAEITSEGKQSRCVTIKRRATILCIHSGVPAYASDTEAVQMALEAWRMELEYTLEAIGAQTAALVAPTEEVKK